MNIYLVSIAVEADCEGDIWKWILTGEPHNINIGDIDVLQKVNINDIKMSQECQTKLKEDDE